MFNNSDEAQITISTCNREEGSLQSLEQSESCVQTYSGAIEEFQQSVPFIDRAVSAENLEQDSLLLACQIFPQWRLEDLKVSRCTDGITNKLLKVTNQRLEKVVLIRCYGTGTSSIIDRENELVSLVTLSKLGFAPPLYGRFANGFCYGYIDGVVLSAKDLCDMSLIGPLIAKHMARWHAIEFPLKNAALKKEPALWSTMERWLALVPTDYSSATIQQKFIDNQDILGRQIIQNEIQLMEMCLRDSPHSKVVFCHNDLLAANIIFHHAATGTQEAYVSFIDYEYGNYSFNSFDIANHFNEFCGVECDFSKYPAANVQKQWIRHYLAESKRIHQQMSTGNNSDIISHVSDDEVDNLYNDVQKFALVSHFYWAIWGLVQASVSDIDFDYMQYAIMRFQQYYKMKEYIKF